MRRIVTLAILLVLGAHALTAVGAAGEPPHIVDPALDPFVHPTGPIVGIPEPSIDLRAVTFSREGGDLVATIEVEDIDYRARYPARSWRDIGAYFYSDVHEHVSITAFESRYGGWRVFVHCTTGSSSTCFYAYDDPPIDAERNTVTVRAPLDLIQGRVLRPGASSGIQFGECRCWMPQPTFGVMDFAPNQGRGRDFDPYSD